MKIVIYSAKVLSHQLFISEAILTILIAIHYGQNRHFLEKYLKLLFLFFLFFFSTLYLYEKMDVGYPYCGNHFINIYKSNYHVCTLNLHSNI